MPVCEAQERIDSYEFSEWCAYFSLEPFGEERGDIRIAQLCALVANAVGVKGRKSKPEDFMPFSEKRGEPGVMDIEAMQGAILKAAGKR